MILDMEGYSIDFDKWVVTAPNVEDMPITLLEVNGNAVTSEPSFVGEVEINTVWKFPPDEAVYVKISMTGALE